METRLLQDAAMARTAVKGFSLVTAMLLFAVLGIIGLALLPGWPSGAPAAPSRPAARPSSTTAEAFTDSYGDGLPDRMRLEEATDRERFRHWFAVIAEMQYYYPNPAAAREVDDCAALIRHAMHEALRRHDGEWRRLFASPVEIPLDDVTKYNYPRTPLGTNLYRTRPGPLRPSDLEDGTFREFADAGSLVRYNTHPVGREAAAARKGDLLVFYQPQQKQPYHTMIFLGASDLAGDGAADWVIYHTGEGAAAGGSPAGAGQIKKVLLSVLRRHPAVRWRPAADNPAFLGFYRLNILR